VAVSGSVGLELLFHAKPSVVVYRVSPVALRVGSWFKTSPFISLVNLLAGRELFPEYLPSRCEAEAVAGHVRLWLGDAAAYQRLRFELEGLRDRVAEPGACRRAAEYLVRTLESATAAPAVPRTAA
jgi:lipid-A-disaccharide synthase